MGEVHLGDGAPGLAILGHLDVVPGWTEGVYPPYELTKQEDVYYGRGVIDDKGPMISALFALYYFLDQGISLDLPVMLLAGTDEENGSSDLEYYRKNHTLPAMVITPDASYPIINGEKGMLRFLLQSDVVVIPKSTHKERMEQNLDVFDFTLTEQEMQAIRQLDEGKSLFFSHYDPTTVEMITNMGKTRKV